MMHAGQRRHRLGARLAAADRHMGRLVGAEDRQRMFQRLQPVAEFIEFCEGHAALPNSESLREDINCAPHGKPAKLHLRRPPCDGQLRQAAGQREDDDDRRYPDRAGGRASPLFHVSGDGAWDTPAGRKAFSLTPEFADRIEGARRKPGSLQRLPRRRPDLGLYLGEAGFQVKAFFLICVIVAGLFGGLTVSRKILFIQALPAAVALIVLMFSR